MGDQRSGEDRQRAAAALALAGAFAAIGVAIGLVGGLIGTRRQGSPSPAPTRGIVDQP